MRQNGWTQNDSFSWDDVPETGPAPLDEGLYRAKIVSAKPSPSKAGNPMITLGVEIYEDAEGNKLKSPSGKETKRKVNDYITLTQDAAFRVKILCKAFGLDPKTSLPNNSAESAAAFCKELVTVSKNGVYVRIKHETRTTSDGERTDMRVGRYLSDEQVKQSAEGAPAADADAPPPPRRQRGNAAAQA